MELTHSVDRKATKRSLKVCKLPLQAAEAEVPRDQGRKASVENRMEIPMPMMETGEKEPARDFETGPSWRVL